ncbi:hypothetical protein BN903_182 [Halorubrum sp. AJ67]|nr:hypothetical protein BN903_182 [Halorubrum sp. AJ67]
MDRMRSSYCSLALTRFATKLYNLYKNLLTPADLRRIDYNARFDG